jgi:catechol-2,3-dioxygenase
MSDFSHIVLKVSDLKRSTQFYIETLTPLGFSVADSESGRFVRLTNGQNFVIVLSQVEKQFNKFKYHRKAVGLNHFAIRVASKDEVDRIERHLSECGVILLGNGKVETGYRKGYYCLLFEDPDRIMIEVVYHTDFYYSRNLPNQS